MLRAEKTSMWKRDYVTTADGAVVATADRVGRKRWSVEASGELYRFQRESLWRPDQALMLGAKKVGTIKRASKWRGEALAELGYMRLPVQVFVLAVVVTMWNQQAAAAGAGAAVAAGG